MTPESKQTVLVTGGAGYIGSVLVELLLERDYTVRVLDRLFWGRSPLNQWLDRVELIHQDVRQMDEDLLDGVDAVIHLAGLSNDPTAEYCPEANWEMNALATERLANACIRKGVRRLTFGSSCSIYDGIGSTAVLDETSDVAPRGAYARSKHYAEQALLRASGRNGFHPVILRQGTVYGPSPRMRYDLVVNTFLKDSLSAGSMQLHGGGLMYRPLVEVHDAALAHIACIEAPPEAVSGEIFNVVHSNYQIRELVEVVAEAFESRSRRVTIASAGLPAIVRDYRCSGEKLAQRVGFRPQTSVGQSVQAMLDFVDRGRLWDWDNPYYYNIRWLTLLQDVFTPTRLAPAERNQSRKRGRRELAVDPR